MKLDKRCDIHGMVEHDTWSGCSWCKEMAEERSDRKATEKNPKVTGTGGGYFDLEVKTEPVGYAVADLVDVHAALDKALAHSVSGPSPSPVKPIPFGSMPGGGTSPAPTTWTRRDQVRGLVKDVLSQCVLVGSRVPSTVLVASPNPGEYEATWQMQLGHLRKAGAILYHELEKSLGPVKRLHLDHPLSGLYKATWNEN